MNIRDLTAWSTICDLATDTGGRNLPKQRQSRLAPLRDDDVHAFEPDPQSHNLAIFAGPCVDVVENEREYRFEIELPGLRTNEIDLFIANNVLTVKGDKKPNSKSDGDRSLRSERSYGTFERSFSLPFDADDKQVAATIKNGILAISVAKKSLVKSSFKRIRINRP